MKRKVKPDDQYLVNLRDVSPVKNQLISENYEESVVVNRIACGDARDQKDNIEWTFRNCPGNGGTDDAEEYQWSFLAFHFPALHLGPFC